METEQQPKAVQLCVFDVEHDYPEGEEAQQILAYHPEACSADGQTSVVGLAQALLTFSSNFAEARWCSCFLLVFDLLDEESGLCYRRHLVIACMPIGISGLSTDQRETS